MWPTGAHIRDKQNLFAAILYKHKQAEMKVGQYSGYSICALHGRHRHFATEIHKL